MPFATVLACLGVNAAITFFIHPNQQAAALLAPPLDYAWITLYGLGGTLILVGIAFGLTNVETAGCLAFGFGAAVSALTTAVVAHWAAWNTIVILVLFTGAALTRARHLWSGRVLVLLSVADVQTHRRRR